ncbi:MAG: ribose-5-phosphate isomerase RpiA [Paracoccaceae bacterium]
MADALSPSDIAKRAAAAKALDFVEDGMKLGLGTGSTAKWFVELLAESGKRVTGVPTSSVTKAQADRLGIPLLTLDQAGWLDLVVDGADEFDPDLNLIKGAGGALLQEKIVAAASDRMIVISDTSKQVETLGAFPLSVEVIRFGWETTGKLISRCLAESDVEGQAWAIRSGENAFVTDEGHFILDLNLKRIGDAASLNRDLNLIPGVVETGLFCGIASVVVVGAEDGSIRTFHLDE